MQTGNTDCVHQRGVAKAQTKKMPWVVAQGKEKLDL